MDNVTLDQLRVLEALHRTGSVSATARELHRAQSAVSYALKTLETALDLPIVDHAGYRTRLTPVGEAILAKAELVLGQTDALQRLASALRGGAEPTLSILLHAVLPTEQLMPVLAELNEREPNTQVTLRVAMLGGLTHMVEQEPPDLMLAPRGLYRLPPHYQHEDVGTVNLLCVVGAEHPLARQAAPVSLEEARRHIHLVITSPPGLQTPVDAGMIGAPRRWNFPDFGTRLQGLRAGLGFAWMPIHWVLDDLRRGTLVPVPLEQRALLETPVQLSYRTEPSLGPTGRYVREALRSHAAAFPAIPADLRISPQMT